MKDTRDFQTIKVEVEDNGLGRLTLNRPDRLNAIGATMLQELAEAARWFDSHRELRVVIMSGAGRAFCAGADLQDSPAAAADSKSNSWLYRREVGQYGLRASDAIEQMRAVTIAQVHGYAVGGGVVLMAVCDLRVAAGGRMVLHSGNRSRRSHSPGAAFPKLVREIGPAMTKELVMTCRRFSPHEAKAMGFVNRVVPVAKLQSETEELARELIEKPSVPVAITKEHVNAVTRAMSAGITAFADGDGLLGASAAEESRAAARAYREKTFRKKG